MLDLPKTNRKQKDKLFRRLFDGEEYKKNLLILYNAVNGTQYTNLGDLEITTLEDAIFLSMKNDVSFIIEWTMQIYEHQSSFCPNMPVRGLMYAARLYEKFIKANKLNVYGTKQLALPNPRYIVFYNGDIEKEDCVKLRLSDLFEKATTDGEFQWTATMPNINLGHNRELMEQCRPLMEYAIYVDKFKRYVKQMEIEAAAMRAVNECIEEDVLKDFLIKHKAEVIDLILTEYDEKETMEMIARDAKMEGRQQGLEQKSLEDARNLLDVLEPEIIAEKIGLPLETVIRLREENTKV